ncbi:hypothetical protein BJY16_004382 [Actinoplanes octamycinicus]|uniref:Uncharacterized protein n=1 Tax=Actinoplanes octamycinicus TaxID=135948 RepID=A0A7W7GZ40_9ACTN|nr:hypothetical protein [Actinoplanes octamycinicus]MBB4740923.1 hypothetical protein [Actinoplanes octamycinicus]GIE55830.1 hypothetical protein Aoc01nite_12320 [Actinoplanes octamycinicus]
MTPPSVPLGRARREAGLWGLLALVAVAAAAGGAFAALDTRPAGPGPQPRPGPTEIMIPRHGSPTEIPMPTARTHDLTAVPVATRLPS